MDVERIKAARTTLKTNPSLQVKLRQMGLMSPVVRLLNDPAIGLRWEGALTIERVLRQLES